MPERHFLAVSRKKRPGCRLRERDGLRARLGVGKTTVANAVSILRHRRHNIRQHGVLLSAERSVGEFDDVVPYVAVQRGPMHEIIRDAWRVSYLGARMHHPIGVDRLAGPLAGQAELVPSPER